MNSDTVGKTSGFKITDNRRNLWQWILFTSLIVVLAPLAVFLVCVFGLRNSDKIAFSLGGIQVAWYGIFIFIGFVGAIAIIGIKLWRFYQCPIDPFFWFCIIGMFTAIMGARMWSCIIGDTHWKDFWDFKGGGLAIEGGVVLTCVAACIWFPLVLKVPRFQVRDSSRQPEMVRKISFFVYLDAIAPAILLGQVIGRYGNYMNNEVYASAIMGDGGFYKLLEHLFPQMFIDGEWHQPLFFYESCLNWCGLIILFYGFEFIPKQKAGTIGLSYFLWYGIVRLCLEPLRYGDFTFSGSYIMSGLWVGFAFVLIILNLFVSKYWRKVFVFQSILTFKKINRQYGDLLYYLGR